MSAQNGTGRTVQLADGPHTVRFTINRLTDLESTFGSFDAFMAKSVASPITATRLLLWASGAADTVEAAGDRMNGVAINPLCQDLVEEMLAAMGVDLAAPAGGNGVDPTNQPFPTTGMGSAPTPEEPKS